MLIGIIGSFASIGGLLHGFIKDKNTSITYWILIILLLISTIFSSVMYYKVSVINSVKYQANELLENWPSRESIDFAKTGELKGIVLSGFNFIENNKEFYKEDFQSVKNYMLVESGIVEDNGNYDFKNRENLEEAVYMVMRILEDAR